MRKESIIEMIDNRIIESYIKGFKSNSIIEDINTRINNMSTVIKMEGLDISNFINLDFDILDATDIKVRAKYSIFYINHSMRRIKDINWLDSKKKDFSKYSNSQIFRLIKLKDKLSIENSLPF